MRVWVIARLTFQEAARSRILLAAIILGLAFLSVYGVGFHYVYRDVVESTGRLRSQIEISEISNFLLLAGLYAVNFLTVMMSVLTSVATLSGEIASGTIHTLASKPIRRWEIVMGKWLGYTIMLSVYLGLMVGGVMGLVYIISGYTAPHAARGMGLLWLNAILLLSLSVAGGSRLSTLANGVMVFGLFGIAFIGGWIEQFGSLLENQTAVDIGIISSLILPSEALWKRAVFEMQSPLVAALGFSPFSSTSVPSPIFLFYAVFYSVLALSFAVVTFQQRDL
jgi:ABC-type transport system involved in multi-copper enzyme maturation permease subunit